MKHPPLRLLCFHGMHQNGNIFRTKLAAWNTQLQGLVEFHCIDGVHKSIPKILQTAKRTKLRAPIHHQHELRAWWRPNQTFHPTSEVLHHLNQILRTNDAFDGVLGFSQGASLASLLCSADISRQLAWQPRMGIFISGYRTKALNERNLPVPGMDSLHVYGSKDYVVHANESKHLAHLFQRSSPARTIECEHNQGHIIPTDAAVVGQVKKFLLNQLSDHVDLHQHVDPKLLGKQQLKI